MVVFPNSKINLGLNVVSKRVDGYHNIETVFYSVNWQDILEVIEVKGKDENFEISYSGLTINSNKEDNLIYKSWLLIKGLRNIPNIKVHLHKNIPMGAGLGGGSADAAFFINMLDKKFNLGFSEIDKLEMASKIGSDCAFFIQNRPVFAKGKGNEFENCSVDLSSYYILLVYPIINSNTKEAYQGLIPKVPKHNLKLIIETKPVELWKDYVTNDFEETIFKKYPAIQELKDLMYSNNALYASMSGSGSAVFGIFKEEPVINLPKEYKVFLNEPNKNFNL